MLSSGPGSRTESLSDALEGWAEPPVPLDAVPVLPSFPADVFPSWIEAEISALAEFTQTPRDLAAMVVLGVLAAACSRCAIVEVTPGWSEPTNLYVLPAMASGSRKSPVYSPLVLPLLSAEKILADKAKDAITEARTTRAIADKAAVKAEKAAVEAAAAAAVIAADPDKSDEVKQQAEAARVAAAEDAVAKVKLAEAIEVPFVPRLIVNDVTPEKMAQLLVEQGGRLAILSDEGGPLVSLAGRYSTSKEPDAEVWLMSHSGLHAEIRVDRIGRGSDWVKNPALTVCIAIQPVVLRRLHRILQLRERGLLARFLFAMPPNNVGYRKTRTTPVPDKVGADYLMRMTGVVTTLAEWTSDPQRLQLAPGALEKHTLFREAHELRMRPDADLGHIPEWASKLAGAVARIAGLLHVAWNEGEAHKHPVGENTMAAAITVGEYLTEHALAAFSYMGADPAIEDARGVLEWAKRKGLTQFSQRDLHRAMQSRFRKTEDTEPALAVLTGSGWIREVKTTGPGRQGGRSPSPLFAVHPKLLRGSI